MSTTQDRPASTEIATVQQRPRAALALADDQTWWTERQLAALSQMGVDQASDGDKLVFLHVSQKTGLDPFARQIYMIGRWDGRAKAMKQTIQTGIDGYRLVADRADRRDGTTRSYDDTLWADAEGNWTDLWIKGTAPTAAKVVIHRNGHRFSAVAMYREYVQTNKEGNPNPMWSRMPANQLAKCAEALALRKAYPQDLSGLYVEEEMGQADRAPRPDLTPTGSGTAAERVSQVLRQPAPSEEEPVQGEVVDEPTPPPTEEPASEVGGLDLRSTLAKRMFAVMGEAGITHDGEQRDYIAKVLDRKVTSRKDLTEDDARTVIAATEAILEDPYGSQP